MKLYSWGAAPNPRRVLIYMAEKGIEIPVVEAGEGAHLTGDFLARYDGRIVPMLELDDGTQIGEAMAICRFLEEAYPAPPLFGVNRRDRALVDMWERRAETECFAGAAEVFRNSAPAFADRGLPGFEEPIEQIPALIERGKKRIARFYGRIERQLADNRFIAGSPFQRRRHHRALHHRLRDQGRQGRAAGGSHQRPALARRGFRPSEYRGLAGGGTGQRTLGKVLALAFICGYIEATHSE